MSDAPLTPDPTQVGSNVGVPNSSAGKLAPLTQADERRLTTEEVCRCLKAWDAWLGRHQVDPTMGWVHAAFDAAFKLRLVEVERERDAARRAIAAGLKEIAMYRRIAERAESPAEARAEEYREALEHVMTVATISIGEEMRACREIADLVSRVLSSRQAQSVIPSSGASGMLSSHPKGEDATDADLTT